MTIESAQLLENGNYTALAFANDRNDWRTFAALGLIGKAAEALEVLTQIHTPEARFYEAATRWIDGDDARAAHLLEGLALPHAQNLLALIRKPRIQILAHLPADRRPPWDLLSAGGRDLKFDIRNISFHPQDLPNEPYADIHRFYDARTPPDFYTSLTVEWQLLPPNLAELPCPLIGATADYDVHIHSSHAWMQLFDEMLVSSQTEWADVRPLVRGPVSTFPKIAGLVEDLPPLSDAPREIDIFLSGSTFHPLHPDKARLLHQVLSMPDARIHIHNGFADRETYQDLMSQAKVCFTYVRHPGGTPTRGLEALSIGCAVAVQRGCVMALYAGEDLGVLTYDADAGELAPTIRRLLDNWDTFAPRARRGAEVIRREFAQTRVGSQYLRFLTFLAAKPRPARDLSALPKPSPKRLTMSRGWLPRTPGVLDTLLVRNLAEWHAILEKSPDAPPAVYMDLTRALILDYATRNASTEEEVAARAKALDSALTLYRSAMARFPDSLALRFGFVRACLHFGRPAVVQEGLRVARECLTRPLESWQIEVSEDLSPWDFFSEFFNYRSYFDLLTVQKQRGTEVREEMARLVLASLHYYVGEYTPGDVALYARAVELDPEFAPYRFRCAQALLKRLGPDDVAEAAKHLLLLADGSVLWVEALELLKSLQEQGQIAIPNFEALARAESNARRSTVVGNEAWQFDSTALAPAEALTDDKAKSLPAQISRAAGAKRDYLVSAIVPIYRAERFMRGLLEDLEAQTIADRIEIVICDTGSPQNERFLAEGFLARYGNIVYIRTEHRENQNQAANRCIEAATGKYLTLACADDRHRPDALEIMARTLDERPEVGLVYADSLITRTPNETFARNTADRVFRWPEYSLRQLLMYNIFGPQPMWRRAVHAQLDAFHPEYVVAGDYELFSRIARQFGAYHIPDTLGLFLDGGFAMQNQQRGIEDMQRILRQFRTAVTLEEVYPALASSSDTRSARAVALIDLGNNMIASIHPDHALACTFYRQAQELIGNIPVIWNNLGVALCLDGKVDEGMALLTQLARTGDEAARHNMACVRDNAGGRGNLRIGSLLHPILSQLPPLVPPEQTQEEVGPNPPSPFPSTFATLTGKGVEQVSTSETEVGTGSELTGNPSFRSREASVSPPSLARNERVGKGAGGLGQALARNAEGEALFHQGDRQGALRAFEEAIRLDPDCAQAYNNLGAWWYTAGSVEKAISNFERALQLDPDDRDALLNGGQLLAQQKRHEQAKGLFADYLSRHPDDAEIARTAAQLGFVLPAKAEKRAESGNVSLPGSREEKPVSKRVSFVVITAGKRPETLELALRSIRAQNIPEYEILVSGRYEEQPELVYVPCAEAADAGRLGEMRNRAVAEARYEHIVILDDDILLAPDWYANFQAYQEDFDILTSQVRLPDGSRYWDHVYRGEGRGEQRLLAEGETDPRVYMTGGGGWVMKDYVARAVQWDAGRGFYQDEDIDFSRRCQAKGYKIAHSARCRVYHADPTYTSIGRWTVRRAEGRTQAWVETALAGKSALEIYVEGETRLGRDQTAEGADCFRYGALRYPDYEAFQYGLAGLEEKSGGHLPGISWFLNGDPDYLAARQAYGDAQAKPEGRPPACPVQIRPDVKWRDLTRTLRPFSDATQLGLEDYAQEAGPFLLALEAAGTQIALHAARTEDAELRLAVAMEGRIQAMLTRQPEPNGIQISALAPPRAVRRPEARLHIGRVGFDTDRLPPDWVAACNQMDAVWVPSAFNRDTFQRAGVVTEKLAVVPSPLLMSLYDPDLKPLPINGARGFNFLTILDWKRSKGWETLLRAFVQEFRQADDVALILRVHSSLGYTTAQITPKVIGCVQEALKGNTSKMPTLLLHDADIPPINRPNLYRSADCFVLPSHGEGWGRPFMEAMAMGLPVIGTDWGAQRDFMTPQNSYLLRSQLTNVPPGAIKESPLFEGHQWARPDEAHLRRLLRQVFTRREEARAIGAQARTDIAAYCGYERVAALVRAEWARLGVENPSLFADVLLG